MLMIFLNFIANIAVAGEIETYTFAIRTEDVTEKKVIKKLGQKLGINFVIVDYPNFASKLAAVESGEVDFAASITYTPARAERLIFSAPTNVERQYFFGPRNFHSQDIKTIGVSSGSVFGDLALQYNPKFNIVEYHSIEQAKQFIDEGIVDGVIGTLAHLEYMTLGRIHGQRINYLAKTKPVSVVTAKEENRALLKRIEVFALSAEIQRFLRQNADAYEFEVKKLALRQEVLLSGFDFSQPLKVKIKNFHQIGNYSNAYDKEGISFDVVFESCELMGIKCELVNQADESWQDKYTSLITKQIDVLAPFAIVKERQSVAHISNNFFEQEAIVIKRQGYKDNVYRSISELVAERVGVIEEQVFELVLRRHLPHKPFVTYKGAEEQLAGLLAKQVDYIIMTRTAYNQLLRDTSTMLPIIEDSMIGSFYSYGIGIGFQNNEQGAILADLFNEAIELLDLETIIKKYDYSPDWQSVLADEKRFTQNSQYLLIIIILSLIVFLHLWNKQSNTDTLTKLNNRLSLYRKYKNGIGKNQILIYFDINKFKVINDTYGHRVGDLVLQNVAKNIRNFWRYDSYRIGGDEFILIGKISDLDINQCLSNIGFFEFNSELGHSFKVSISYGHYISSSAKVALEDCLHLADTEMYKYK